MAALLWRAAGNPPAAPTTFPDVTKVWQLVPVGWMEAENITTGTSPTEFSPADPVTRSQFATFAWRWQDPPPVIVDDASPLCAGRDEFNGSLQAGWTGFSEGGSMSLSSVPGFLELRSAVGGSFEDLFRAPVAANHEVETKMRFDPSESTPGWAGLNAWEDDEQDSFDGFDLYRADCDLQGCVDDAVFFDSCTAGVLTEGYYDPLPAGTGDRYLRLRHQAGTHTGSYSLDGATWITVESVAQVLSDPVVGVFAGSFGPSQPPPALFDWFEERAL